MDSDVQPPPSAPGYVVNILPRSRCSSKLTDIQSAPRAESGRGSGQEGDDGGWFHGTVTTKVVLTQYFAEWEQIIPSSVENRPLIKFM